VQTRLTSLSGLVLLVVATVAAAHHSPAMFDPSKARVLTGTVRQFQWTNPHCYIQLIVKNEKGVDEEWSLEMGAPTYLYAKGWRPSTVKSGDRLKVTIAPLRKGGTGGMLLQASTLDGKLLGKKP
jgi:uncharacterized protein DUF6152